jgi:hypothetical protein
MDVNLQAKKKPEKTFWVGKEFKKEEGPEDPYEANDKVLDSKYFKRIPEDLMAGGFRDTLTFMKEPSPENAFFVIPEETENQKQVLFAHASINLMK